MPEEKQQLLHNPPDRTVERGLSHRQIHLIIGIGYFYGFVHFYDLHTIHICLSFSAPGLPDDISAVEPPDNPTQEPVLITELNQQQQDDDDFDHIEENFAAADLYADESLEDRIRKHKEERQRMTTFNDDVATTMGRARSVHTADIDAISLETSLEIDGFYTSSYLVNHTYNILLHTHRKLYKRH